MTEQQQRKACAKLAARIGYKAVQEVWSENWWTLRVPNGDAVSESMEGCEDHVWRHAPDYFTDPAASRELVLWLATQERSIQREFVFALREATDEVDLCYELRLLTADLPIIARAACKALGIEVSE